jgi:SNF2 family DNA or RNA helicase
MGTGHTLTAASTVIFLDEPWNRGKKEQAEDRAHRIGTKGTVNIITLIAKDTIDEKLHEIVYKKGKMSDIIVDKEIDAVTNEKMVQYLLS